MLLIIYTRLIKNILENVAYIVTYVLCMSANDFGRKFY